MYTNTHYVTNIPIYGAHTQLNQVPKALQYQVPQALSYLVLQGSLYQVPKGMSDWPIIHNLHNLAIKGF